MKTLIRAVVFLVMMMFLFSTAGLWAQTAQLSGIIKDKSDAVIPNAKLTLVDEDKGIKREVTSNNEGFYSIPLLNPGRYRLSVQAPGFQAATRGGIIMETGESARLDLVLEVGRVEQTVDVTGEAPLMNESAGIGTVINRQLVGNLPLNGRSFQSLILLTPGVTAASPGTVLGTPDSGQFSVNGQRASSNYFTVDGVSANIGISNTSGGASSVALAGAYPGLSVFGGTNNLVSTDALEEFKISTSTYSAEFGRQPGGQISLVTRSGGNNFHGTLFEYLRNDALDAADWFANASGLKKPAIRQNQFGATFSGPIVIPGLYDGHDRTFFFFSYEGQRLRLPASGTGYVPSLRLRSVAAPAVQKVLNSFPQPTAAELLTTTGAPSGWAPYNYSVSNPGTMDAYSIRIDHNVSSKLTLFGRFDQSPSNTTTFSGEQDALVSNASTWTMTLGATSPLTPWLYNGLRINYSHQFGQSQHLQTTNGGAVPVDSELVTNGFGGRGNAQISLSNIANIVYAGNGDVANNYQRQINVVDNVSLVKGSHQFKFGVDYRRLSPTYAIQDLQYAFFLTEAAIKSATASSISIYKYTSAHPRFSDYSFFGQDTWKVTPRLTLDYGLRWELNPAPTLPQGEMPAMVAGVTGIDVSKATLAPTGTPLYKTFYKAFAPRGGVAYQLSQANGRETVLRGGFGVFYDLGSEGAINFPLYALKTQSSVTFPLTAAQATRPTISVPTSLPVTSTVYSNAQDLKLPYTLQWNVALEQSLGTQQMLSVSYVGSAARRLLTTQYLNYPVSGVRPNPSFANIVYTWNGPTSDYNAMQLQYKARLNRGLQALVNYTWSHAIDDVSTNVGSYVLSRGNADFDIRHNLSAAVNFNVPTPKTGSILKYLLANWTMDGIVHAQSGFPVNLTGGYTIVDTVYVYLRPNYVQGQPLYLYDSMVAGGRRFNSSAFTAATSGQQGNFGRNVMRGLSIWQADMALGRAFNLTEKWKLQFKGELFNVFNHPNFGAYGASFTTPSTFGVPTTTLGRSLGGLSYLYQMGGPRSVQLSLKITF